MKTFAFLVLAAVSCRAECQDHDKVLEAVTKTLGFAQFKTCSDVSAFCNLSMSADMIPLTLLDTIEDAYMQHIKTEAHNFKARGELTVGSIVGLACPKTCNRPCIVPTPPPPPRCDDHDKVLKAVTSKMGFTHLKTCNDVSNFCKMQISASTVPPSILETIEYDDHEKMVQIRAGALHYHAHGEYTIGNLIGLACPATCGTPCNPAPQVDTNGPARKFTRNDMVGGLRGIQNHPLLRGSKSKGSSSSHSSLSGSLRGIQYHPEASGDGF